MYNLTVVKKCSSIWKNIKQCSSNFHSHCLVNFFYKSTMGRFENLMFGKWLSTYWNFRLNY